MMRTVLTAIYLAHALLLGLLDQLAAEHLASYGLMLRGLVWALIAFNIMTASRVVRPLAQGGA